MTLPVSAFKAYDIRGRVPDELNAEIAEAIGRAYASFLAPDRVVVGHDIRLSSPEITDGLINGLRAAGVSVSHIGECGTEEIYFATEHYGFDGGIVVTATERRSQSQNRAVAMERLVERLAKLNHRPKRRRSTRPTRASKERRISAKKARGRIKANRKPPKDD